MNEQINHILSKVDPNTIKTVAQAMLNDAYAVPDGGPIFEEIETSHNDLRTIGIVKISGDALSAGKKRRWTTVAKILDPTKIDKDTRGNITLDNEQSVYALGLFTDQGIHCVQQNAICYNASTIASGSSGLKTSQMHHNRRGRSNILSVLQII